MIYIYLYITQIHLHIHTSLHLKITSIHTKTNSQLDLFNKKINGARSIFLTKVGRFGRSFSFSAAAHALWAQSRDGPKRLGIRFVVSFRGVFKWDPFFGEDKVEAKITKIYGNFERFRRKTVHCLGW